ncbi:hypothetical protein Bca4012_052930 [Brassica carinata]
MSCSEVAVVSPPPWLQLVEVFASSFVVTKLPPVLILAVIISQPLPSSESA